MRLEQTQERKRSRADGLNVMTVENHQVQQ